MKFDFDEVNSLKKGLRKIHRKNRYLLSRKDKERLEKAVIILDTLSDLNISNKSSFKKKICSFVKIILKLLV